MTDNSTYTLVMLLCYLEFFNFKYHRYNTTVFVTYTSSDGSVNEQFRNFNKPVIQLGEKNSIGISF